MDIESEEWRQHREAAKRMREESRPESADRPLHPAGTFPLRVADMMPADDGKGKDGKPYPRLLIVWLSSKKDADGNPLWLFTKCPDNTYGGMRNGKPVGKPSRLRGIYEALAGHSLTDKEAEEIGPNYVHGLYALGKVTHWDRVSAKGAQVDVVMPMPEGMEVEIDLSSYVRPARLGGGA
jgi:hypothetical protein